MIFEKIWRDHKKALAIASIVVTFILLSIAIALIIFTCGISLPIVTPSIIAALTGIFTAIGLNLSLNVATVISSFVIGTIFSIIACSCITCLFVGIRAIFKQHSKKKEGSKIIPQPITLQTIHPSYKDPTQEDATDVVMANKGPNPITNPSAQPMAKERPAQEMDVSIVKISIDRVDRSLDEQFTQEIIAALFKQSPHQSYFPELCRKEVVLNGQAHSILLHNNIIIKTPRIGNNAAPDTYDYRITKKMLGRGAHANVYRVYPFKMRLDQKSPSSITLHNEHHKKAVKISSEFSVSDDDLATESALFDIAHPRSEGSGRCRRKPKNTNTTSYQSFFLMPKFSKRSLDNVLMSSIPLSTDLKFKLSLGCLEQVQQVHKTHYIHGDVKPANFTCGKKDWQIRLIDVGTLVDINKARNSTEKPLGSPITMAPEVYYDGHKTKFDYAIDVYSLGVVLAMIFNKQTFESYLTQKLKRTPTTQDADNYDLFGANIHQFIDCIKTNCPDCPQEIIDLLHKMVSKNPNERPGLSGVIAKFKAHDSSITAKFEPRPLPI